MPKVVIPPVSPVVWTRFRRDRNMELGSVNTSVSAIAAQATAQANSKLSQDYGVAVVKRVMDDQQVMADKLMQMIQPKGQNLDIRV